MSARRRMHASATCRHCHTQRHRRGDGRIAIHYLDGKRCTGSSLYPLEGDPYETGPALVTT